MFFSLALCEVSDRKRPPERERGGGLAYVGHHWNKHFTGRIGNFKKKRHGGFTTATEGHVNNYCNTAIRCVLHVFFLLLVDANEQSAICRSSLVGYDQVASADSLSDPVAAAADRARVSMATDV